MSRTGKSIQTESKLTVARGWGQGELRGTELLLWGDENVLKLIVVTDAQLCEYTETH